MREEYEDVNDACVSLLTEQYKYYWGSGCIYPQICMVGVIGCRGSDHVVHMEKWGGDPEPPAIRVLQAAGWGETCSVN